MPKLTVRDHMLAAVSAPSKITVLSVTVEYPTAFTNEPETRLFRTHREAFDWAAAHLEKTLSDHVLEDDPVRDDITQNWEAYSPDIWTLKHDDGSDYLVIANITKHEV